MGKPKQVKPTPRRSRWFYFAIAGLIAAGVGAAFMAWSDDGPLTGSSQRRAPGDRYETVGPDQLPAFAKGNAKVEEAYRYAAAHPEVLQYIPCFCGCKNIGHRHNGDCYVQERHQDGRITFTSHGATWDICLNITRDVMLLKAEGKSLREIRAYIDEKYGKYGPATPTPMPPS